MDTVRAESPSALLVNAGNLLFKRESLKRNQTATAQMTADLILSSYELMRCDAFNIGAYDLSLGVDYLLQKRSSSKLPFLSANLVDKHGKLLFTPYVIKQAGATRIGIFGLIDSGLKIGRVPGSHKIVVDDPFEVAKKIVPELKQKGADLVVLLTDMTSRSLRRTAQLGLPIDLIVGSDERNQVSLPILVQDTYITHLDRGGKSIGRLDISLPGGSSHQASRLTDLTYKNSFVELRISIPDHPKVGALVAEVTSRISDAQKDSIAGQEGPGESECGKRYVGAEACGKCHPGRHKAWLETAHAHAYQTLVRKNKQYDEECIVCHSLAYQCDLGEPDLKNMGAFANVQCESCHGPGDAHVKSEGKQEMAVDKKARTGCLRCHTPEKSADSGYQTRLKEICSDPG